MTSKWSMGNPISQIMSIQQKMMETATSTLNGVFSNMSTVFLSSGAEIFNSANNFTALVSRNAGKAVKNIPISAKNFTNCVNMSQVNSLKDILVSNLTTCIQNQANTATQFISTQKNALGRLTSAASSLIGNTLRCATDIANIVACLNNVVKNATTEVTSYATTSAKLITNLPTGITLCGQTIALQLEKSFAQIGMDTAGCVQKTAWSFFSNGTSTSSTTSTTTTTRSTTVANSTT